MRHLLPGFPRAPAYVKQVQHGVDVGHRELFGLGNILAPLISLLHGRLQVGHNACMQGWRQALRMGLPCQQGR